MRIYYDNSQNGDIIFGIAFIVVFFIVIISNIINPNFKFYTINSYMYFFVLFYCLF